MGLYRLKERVLQAEKLLIGDVLLDDWFVGCREGNYRMWTADIIGYQGVGGREILHGTDTQAI